MAQVSTSGYYKWLKSADKPEFDYQDYLIVKDLFEAGKAKHGVRTMAMKLMECGIPMNHKEDIKDYAKVRSIYQGTETEPI